MKNLASSDASIKNAALALLARREHSKYELALKLARKFSDSDKVEEQITALAQDNLQSEERFVESFIRAKKSHGKGPKFIKQELRQRGISEYLIAAYVYEDDEDWRELAKQVYTKKFGLTPVSDAKDKGRRIRFMVSRGFSADDVMRLLSN